jgi:hypothetical protein
LHQSTEEERRVPLEALNCKLDMPGGIDSTFERTISLQRKTYHEAAVDNPLVLLYGETHAGGNTRGRIIDAAAICPGHIWIRGRLLTGLRRAISSAISARNEEPRKSSANNQQENNQ